MNVSFTFMNSKSSDHFKDYVHEKLNRFDKLLDDPGSAGVVLRSEKLHNTAEINTINADISLPLTNGMGTYSNANAINRATPICLFKLIDDAQPLEYLSITQVYMI